MTLFVLGPFITFSILHDNVTIVTVTYNILLILILSFEVIKKLK